MDKRELEIGDILQINIDHEQFPGFLVVVTEPKTWGAQGYLLSSRDFEAIKFDGRAFIRVLFEGVEYCGKIQWIEE